MPEYESANRRALAGALQLVKALQECADKRSTPPDLAEKIVLTTLVSRASRLVHGLDMMGGPSLSEAIAYAERVTHGMDEEDDDG